MATKFKVGDRLRNIHADYMPPATVTELTACGFKYELDSPWVIGSSLGTSTGGESYEDSQWEAAPPAQVESEVPAALLPCPFCGSVNLSISNELDEDANWVVWCLDCKGGSTFCEHKAEAISHWNARALSASTVAQPAEERDWRTVHRAALRFAINLISDEIPVGSPQGPLAAAPHVKGVITQLRKEIDSPTILSTWTGTAPAPSISEQSQRIYFCSCGGACNAEEYIEHFFVKGHDRGDPAPISDEAR